MTPRTAGDPPRRASGRDLPVAIVVGVAMLVAVVASLFIRKEAFAVVAILAVCAGLWELAQAFTRRDIHLPLLPLLVGAIGILVSAYTRGPRRCSSRSC